MGIGIKAWMMLVGSVIALGAFAFQPIPGESAKALGRTRGKPFSSGAVFVNGKYIEPPYVVERWGTGIRINGMQVTGQILDWNEFLKTQTNVKVEKKEVAPAQPAPAPAPVQPAAVTSAADEMSSLDDLFDDDPKPKKASSPKPFAAPAAPKPAKPVVTYVLDGEFKHNDETKALVGRINATRTEIDRALRSGGFICFGNSYSQVQGDKRTFMEMLEKLPEAMQRSSDEQSFHARIRAARLVYLNEVLCQDLYRNRTDYRKLKERREKIKSAQKWDKIIEEVSDPLF